MSRYLIAIIVLLSGVLMVGIMDRIYGRRDPDSVLKDVQATQKIIIDAVVARDRAALTQPVCPAIADLMADPKSRAILGKLPHGQFDGQAFHDPWGGVMRWEKSRRPGSSCWVLVSAGPDEDFDARDDNICSDGS